MFNVCIDPGHGGKDPGAIGNGLQEKDLVLVIAKDLKGLLIANGVGVVMTRSNDVFVDLHPRAKIANDFKADLFCSIHINAGGGTGQEVLVIGMGGQAEVSAKILLGYLLGTCGWMNRGVKVFNGQVLRDTIMPAILTENGFIDKVEDVNKLWSVGFLHKIAVAHAKGICEFAGIKFKEEGVIKVTEVVQPVKKIAIDDVFLTVRLREIFVPETIKKINELGFACKKLDLA